MSFAFSVSDSGISGLEEYVSKLLYNCELNYSAKRFILHMTLLGLGFGLGIGIMFVSVSFGFSFLAFLLVFIIFEILVYGMLVAAANNRINIMEEVLPDFLSIMASNIKSGMTYDRALLLSARKEFGPLSREIDNAAKDALTGKTLGDALLGIAKRLNSEVFSKTMRLIVEGISSGGNLGELLETAALDMRKFSAIRKEVSATVLTYELFIFGATAVGAPLLFAVGNFLVKLIYNMRSQLKIDPDSEAAYILPFFKGASALSPQTVFLFSLGALIINSVFGSLAAGVISKGKESEGFVFIPILITVSFAVFFLVSFLLGIFFRQIIGG